jgi:hypothetical protein
MAILPPLVWTSTTLSNRVSKEEIKILIQQCPRKDVLNSLKQFRLKITK